jgi:dihydropyrimidine dehydrogenase (NAD+) subunit PreA
MGKPWKSNGHEKPIDWTTNTAGIVSPNPFWLASGPPTNTADQVMRAFDAGWGGAVWKTLGEPIVNVSSRLGGHDVNGLRLMGLNNIELITDRPLEINLREIRETKKRYPKHAVIVSLMVESKRETWHEIVKQTCDVGADGIELNFGCPHGMSERGMGAAVGQVPEYACQITEWVKEVSTIPVLVKLTPNVSDIRYVARAAAKGGADGLSLINTINSIIGIDLDRMQVLPGVDGRSSHGGYCGPAVKPIALHLLTQVTTDPETRDMPISGIGGISTWKDALEFLLLGSTSLQVCTAAMHYGYRIVEDLQDGLGAWMRANGYSSVSELRGKLKGQITDWGNLNLNYKVVARIDPDKCIHCNLCHIACEDGAHQCIEPVVPGVRETPEVDEVECVGCNLCSLVCPVENCITMTRVDGGAAGETWKERVARTGSSAAAWAASPIAQSRHGHVMTKE